MADISEQTEELKISLLAKEGKYLTFKLDGEEFGIEILKVQEIIGMMDVTQVPKTPDFVRGVINLRGKVIPVVDLRLKFELEKIEDSDRTCIIVVQIVSESSSMIMGILVDEVSEVLEIAEKQIEEPPVFGAFVDIEFILGMGKVGEKVIMLLDVEKVLSGNEIGKLSPLNKVSKGE